MHDVTHYVWVIAVVAAALGALIIGALASVPGLPGDHQQPDVGRRRRRLTRVGLATLSFGFAVVVALVLSSAGLAAPGGTAVTAVLHKIGEGVERLQARWNAPAPRADSGPVRSVTLDPPVQLEPGPAEKHSPDVGANSSVTAAPAAPVASLSVPSVAFDPPATVGPALTKMTPPAGANRSVAKTPAAPAAALAVPSVALAPPIDLPPEASEQYSWASLLASVDRPVRVDLPLVEPFVGELLTESAPPPLDTSSPTTSSPPTPRTSPPTTSSGPGTGRSGSSVAASIQTPPAPAPAAIIKPPKPRERDDDGKKRERRERGDDREGKRGRDQVNYVTHTERGDKVERGEKIERAEKVERVDKIERVSKVERVEKVERPQKIERVEKIERPQKIERVQKVERVERPARVERREKIEKPERRGRN